VLAFCAADVQALGAVQSIGGDLSPLPFQSLRNASEAELKCFQGGLGQATDTYNVRGGQSCGSCCGSSAGAGVAAELKLLCTLCLLARPMARASGPPVPSALQIYLVAANAMPTFTGLAPQCGHFAAAAAAAGNASAGGGDSGAGCPAAPQLDCAQARVRPDAQTLQSGAVQAWALTNAGNGSDASGSTLEWQAAGGAAAGRPARVQLSLEGGAAPAFTRGPSFSPEERGADNFTMRFALDKPALLIYAGERLPACLGLSAAAAWMAAWAAVAASPRPLPARSFQRVCCKAPA
jgi:hypothetical protein